jgi:hypothetical protein
MAKFSMKQGGKEVGPASVYAQPHDMSGKSVKVQENPGKEPNRSKLDTSDISVGQYSKSAGNEPVKTDGIKMRGAGAATKGTMCRGPMA